METIGAAKFKEQCLALLDRLDADGLVVTKRGKPVAQVVPYEQHSAALIGSLRDKIEIRGDILTTGPSTSAWRVRPRPSTSGATRRTS